jgi:hypothetical protein
MSRARYDYSPTAATYEPQGRGYFSGYLLPPVAVLIVGCLLALFVFNVTPANLNVRAASPQEAPHDPLLDSAVGAFAPTAPTPAPGGSGQATVDTVPGQPAAPLSQTFLQLSFPNLDVQAAPASGTALSSIFTPSIQYWGKAISRWSAAAGLDPNMAAVVMQIESCGDPSATSRSGAIGLFQVMPFHFTASDSPYDPDTNALRGLDYLRRSLAAAKNDAKLAFAGYNGGIGVISRSEWTWPAETVRYAYWASGIYADAIGGQKESSRLNEWYTVGGAGMCTRANQRLGIDN